MLRVLQSTNYPVLQTNQVDAGCEKLFQKAESSSFL